MNTIVLAGTAMEAAAHAQRHRLPKGRWRYAVKASSIRGLRVAEVHILPGFLKRLDRHKIIGELRYARVPKTIEFHETPKMLGLQDAIEPAYTEQEVRLNAGRLTLEEALEQAYVTVPSYISQAAPDIPVKRKKAPATQPLGLTLAPDSKPLTVEGFF